VLPIRDDDEMGNLLEGGHIVDASQEVCISIELRRANLVEKLASHSQTLQRVMLDDGLLLAWLS
jgi:hypothetical protein